MRVFLLCFTIVMPGLAHAWSFEPGLPCRLTHASTQALVELTYDPNQPIYTITITRPEPWPDAEYFGMRFDGPQGRQIGTDRHKLSADGRSLTVADVGFGNVLDGLQFNHTAGAASGDVVVTFSLEGAAEPVAKFRTCAAPAKLS